jgi:hypothetical protein
MKHTNKMVNIESNPLNGSSFMNELRNKYMEKHPNQPKPNKKFWQIKVELKNYYTLAKFLLTLLQLRRQKEQNNIVEISNTKEK